MQLDRFTNHARLGKRQRARGPKIDSARGGPQVSTPTDYYLSHSPTATLSCLHELRFDSVRRPQCIQTNLVEDTGAEKSSIARSLSHSDRLAF